MTKNTETTLFPPLLWCFFADSPFSLSICFKSAYFSRIGWLVDMKRISVFAVSLLFSAIILELSVFSVKSSLQFMINNSGQMKKNGERRKQQGILSKYFWRKHEILDSWEILKRLLDIAENLGCGFSSVILVTIVADLL